MNWINLKLLYRLNNYIVTFKWKHKKVHAITHPGTILCLFSPHLSQLISPVVLIPRHTIFAADIMSTTKIHKHFQSWWKLLLHYIAHETAICHNLLIFNFTWDTDNLTNPQQASTYACYIFTQIWHASLINSVYVTQPSSNAWISVWLILWVITSCCFNSDILLHTFIMFCFNKFRAASSMKCPFSMKATNLLYCVIITSSKFTASCLTTCCLCWSIPAPIALNNTNGIVNVWTTFAIWWAIRQSAYGSRTCSGFILCTSWKEKYIKAQFWKCVYLITLSVAMIIQCKW